MSWMTSRPRPARHTTFVNSSSGARKNKSPSTWPKGSSPSPPSLSPDSPSRQTATVSTHPSSTPSLPQPPHTARTLGHSSDWSTSSLPRQLRLPASYHPPTTPTPQDQKRIHLIRGVRNRIPHRQGIAHIGPYAVII